MTYINVNSYNIFNSEMNILCAYFVLSGIIFLKLAMDKLLWNRIKELKYIIWKDDYDMAKYTDEEIRALSKVTCKIAGEYLGISSMAISYGLRQETLPIGFAVHKEDRYSESWGYYIIAERLIAYKYGKITTLQIETIENNLNRIIKLFEETKIDLLYLLKDKQ